MDGVYLGRNVKAAPGLCAGLLLEASGGKPEGQYVYVSYLGRGKHADCFKPALDEPLVGWNEKGELVQGRVKGYRSAVDSPGVGFMLSAEKAVRFRSGLICTAAAQERFGFRPLRWRPMTEAERSTTEKRALSWAEKSYDNDEDAWVNDEFKLKARRVHADESHYAVHFWYKGNEFEYDGGPGELYDSKIGLLLVQDTYGASVLTNLDSADREELLESPHGGE